MFFQRCCQNLDYEVILEVSSFNTGSNVYLFSWFICERFCIHVYVQMFDLLCTVYLLGTITHECHIISNHRKKHYLFNSFFRQKSQLLITVRLCGESLHKGPVIKKAFPCHMFCRRFFFHFFSLISNVGAYCAFVTDNLVVTFSLSWDLSYSNFDLCRSSTITIVTTNELHQPPLY